MIRFQHEFDERDDAMHDAGYFRDCPDADCPMPYDCFEAGVCMREAIGEAVDLTTYDEEDYDG